MNRASHVNSLLFRLLIVFAIVCVPVVGRAATPSITTLNPTSGVVGTSVTISGSNFGTTQGSSTVKFNGTAATSITSWATGSIVAKVPTGATTGNVVVTVGGVASNGVSFSVVVAPSITALSPTSGAVGTSVTISGSNFGSTQGTSTVKFNGTSATSITSWAIGSIVAKVPTGATTGNAVVTVGGVASNGVSFTVAPSITTLSPTSGAPGTSVTISGSNFGTTQGSSTVKFNGTAATSITSWATGSIVAKVPTGATTGNVVVTVGGVASNGVLFTVAPSITTLSPTSGVVGTSVTISGLNFGSTQGTSTVKFNGTSATSITSWATGSIVAKVPTGATTGNAVVTVGGVASNGVSFSVVVAPSITTLNPTSGAVGTSVTISGSNFGSSQGSSTVTFNGTSATSITSWATGSIVAKVPTGATTGNVVVTVGGVASNGVSFTVAPSITTLNPTSGAVGTSVTISGSNFGSTQGTSTVKFNGTAATSITSWAIGSIMAKVPTGATTGNVVVTVGGIASNGVSFTVVVAPSITTLNSTSGAVGTSVTISGSNFGATQGTSTVKFNGTTATTATWTNTSIGATVPTGATNGDVVVTVNGASSNGISFTVLPTPTVTGLSPASGLIGASVTITGTNFSSTQGGVKFNGAAATISSWSDTSISTTVPTGATTGNVVVTASGVATNGLPFTVLIVPPPTFSLPAGDYPTAQDVTINDSDTAAMIYYTTDGTTPTTDSIVYDSAYPISVYMNQTLKAIAVAEGYSNSVVATAVYTIQAVPPSFSPAAGRYVGSQAVTITDDSSSYATIYYTTDGSTPSPTYPYHGTHYTGPFTVTSTATVKAIANVYHQYSNSQVSSATYTITSVPDMPVISPSGGSYPGAQLVTISETSLNATVYYTLGNPGTTPTTSSTAYTGGAITVSSTATLEAIAVVDGYTPSSVATATYTLPPIAASTTTLAVASGGAPVTFVASGSVVTLTATVVSGAMPVLLGTVNFCDATAASCTDVHLLGTAQLTNAGTATIKLQPGIGSHSYRAVFVETSSYLTSSSTTAQLTVMGIYPTSTTIVGTGIAAGRVSLTAEVAGMGSNSVAPTGKVSALDTNNGNAVLSTGLLTPAGTSVALSKASTISFPKTIWEDTSVIAAGDFDGDGSPDLAVISSDWNSSLNQMVYCVTILLDNGDGTFSQPATGSPFTLNSEPQGIAAGDFNRDGKLDLALRNADGTITILLGNGDGTFTTINGGVTLHEGFSSFAVGDFNRDGKLDLAVTSYGYSSNGSVTIFLGNGDGTFIQAVNTSASVGLFPDFIAVGDFNEDGIPDLVVTDYNGPLVILHGIGDGTFSPVQQSGLPNFYETNSVAVGDFYGLGHLDLAVTTFYEPWVYILKGNGDGTFNPPTTVSVGNGPYSVVVGDFNRDGNADLGVVNDYDATVSVVLNNPNNKGTFLRDSTVSVASGPPQTDLGFNSRGPQSVALGDFNRDGVPDLAAVNFNNTANPGTSIVTIVQTNESVNATSTVTGIVPVGSGTHYVDANYGGDSRFAGSTSDTIEIQLVPENGLVTLIPAQSWFGSPVVIMIKFFPLNGQLPTGTVTCSGAGVTSAPVTLDSKGSATIQMNGLPVGKDAIVCSFSSSGNFTSGATSPMIETVIPAPVAGSVSVTPSSASLYGGQVQQFRATVFNTSNQAVTWGVSPSSGAGTISATGLYTAPATVTSQQTITITATSQANPTRSASAMITLAPPQHASSGYGYQRAIVIDYTKISNADLTNFPFLFSTTDAAFKTTANGGHVSNSSGYDIIFSTDPSGITRLDHELEEYNSQTGQVTAWVRIPTLSHTENTVLYVFYGNSSVTTPQENPAGVWDSNYTAVYHLGDVEAGIEADSTGNGHNATPTSISAASGEIDGAAGFNGVSGYLQIPSADFASYPTSGSTTTESSISFGTWFKTASPGVILGQTDGTAPGGDPGGWQPALYVDIAGRLTASVFSHGDTNDQIVTAKTYNDNNWHFVVDTYTNGFEELYVDGQFAGTQQVPEIGYNSSYAYFLGTGETAHLLTGNGSWLYFNGAIDEVNVSNIARSGDFIQTQYNNQSSPSTFYSLNPENTEEALPGAVSLRASQSQQFTILGAAPGSWSAPTVIWSMPAGSPGTLTASGLYTAPNSIASQQTVTITGTPLGGSTQSVSATVTLIPAVTISLTPSSAMLSGGQTQQLTAAVSNSANTVVSWTISPAGVGTVSSTGLYTAPASVSAQQTVIVAATSQADLTQSASATISLMPPVTVNISPSGAMLYVGQSQQFTATVANTSNTAINYAISPEGLGTLSPAGLYTAPASVASPQTITITATSVADITKSDTITIILLPRQCVSNGYSYQRAIAIDHTKVPNTDQTSFPVLISGTYPFLATTANGGRLQNANGYDIAFTSDPAGQNNLDYEIDSYNGTTGAVAYWVRIPVLSHSADTVLFMWYGNPSITSSQENKAGVWSNNYAGVWHFGTSSAPIAGDSTANANNGINNGVLSAAGIVGVSGTFDGTGNTYLDIPSSTSFKPAATLTIQAWVNITAQTWSPSIISLDYSADGNWNSPSQAYGLDIDGGPWWIGFVYPSHAYADVAVNVNPVASSDPASITVGQWVQLVGVYDGSNLSIYANGIATNTQPQSGAIDYGASQDLAIGRNSPYLSGGAINGLIDEARVSSAARSSDWIATEYNNETSPSTFYALSTETGSVSPSAVSLSISQSQQFFTTMGTCNSVTWSMPSGSPGTLTLDGLYTAPASIDTQQIVVITATSQTESASATVTLVPPIAITVTPADAQLYDASQPLQLTVSVTNTTNTAVTWTISPEGTGTISQSGLYTAPASVATQETVTVTAISQADATKSASVTVTLLPSECVSNGYINQRTIVIDHTKVPNADQTNFPFLFNTTDPIFKSTANGGQIASPNGYDIIFSLDPNGFTKLDHELEKYNPVTGQVIAWVRIPTLSHTTDTVVYVFFGNPNTIAPQQNATGVWDSNYRAVYHLASTGTGVATDSTAYVHGGTFTSVSGAAGKIDGATSFNGTSGYIQIPETDFPSYPTADSFEGTPVSGEPPFAASFGLWFKTASPGGILAQSPNPSCWYFFVCIPNNNDPKPGDFDPPSNPMLYIDDNGHLEFDFGNVVSQAAYNDNVWHYAVITYADNGTNTLYVDGRNAGSEQQAFAYAYSPNYVYFVGSTYTWLSELGNSDWLYFNGDIDEVTVSSIPRSSDWIRTEYNNQGSPSTFYTFNPASSVQVAPSAASLYGSQSQQFAATASCDASVTWSMPSGAKGTLTLSGLYIAPAGISAAETVTITATSQLSGIAIGSAVVTLLPPPPPITLTAAVQPPYAAGTLQTFTATLRDQYGTPEPDVVVTFFVAGANNNFTSSTTDSDGVASYSYTGANSGNDNIRATASFNGELPTSSSVSVSWVTPGPLSPEGGVVLKALPMLGQSGLVGAFTNSNGAVIEPIAIGASPRVFVVPAGATRLQLGINDNHYADNGGPGFIVAVNGVSVAVPPTAMPWNWVTGGLNNNYQYAMNDGTSPVVAATGLTAGDRVSIAYQSGTASTDYQIRPLVNADGDPTWITGVQIWQGAYYPSLYMASSYYPVGQPVTLNALVTNGAGTPISNVPVTLDITGANAQQLAAITDSTGTATFIYVGTYAGTDSLQVEALPSGEDTLVSNQVSITWTNYATPPPVGSLAFTANTICNAAPNCQGQGYLVAAKDSSGSPVFNTNVGFYVSGANVLSDGGTTDINGQVPFGFSHNPGAYTIVIVDSVNRNVVTNTLSGQWSPSPTTNPSGNEITVGVSAPTSVSMPNTLQLNGTATDSLGNSLTATWSQVSGPGTVTFTPAQQQVTNGTFTAIASFSEVGSYVLQVTATNGLGGSGSVQIPVTVAPPQDPQGWVGSPAYGSTVTGVVPITLAPGVALQSGILTYYPANNSNSVTVLNSNTTGSGQIGTLDTTTMVNGTYWIQLQATNTTGQQQYGLVLVTVAGNYKPGRLTTVATDLVVPATGMPINIQRQYDSLNAGTSSDFGHGWSLGINVDLTVDPRGNVTFTLGGQRRTFYLIPQQPSLGAIGTFPWYWPVYVPEPGLHGTLKESGSNCTFDMFMPDGSMWICLSGGVYTATGFIFTDPAGTSYTISANGALQSIMDLSGNGLTITPNGITSTTGLSVPFVRDASHRITQIIDPQGNLYSYSYDASGNLASVTYPNSTTPRYYTYDTNHRYTGGTDSRGYPLPVTTYYTADDTDSNGLPLNGRLHSITDALNNPTNYAYDLAANTTTVTYPDNGTKTLVYDSYGMLLSDTDPLEHATTNTYDGNHNLISTTDPLGHATTYTYDANGNRTSTTYPATATSVNTTSTSTYNQYSEQTSATDELGHVRTFNYDANYNPESTTDSLGIVASFLFSGNSTLQAGAVGYDMTVQPAKASQFAYDTYGSLISSTDALGRTTSYTYNSLGNKLSMTVPPPNGSTNTAASTTTFQYDAVGNLIQTNAPLGSVNSSSYDANGNRISSTDARGNTTTYTYDPLDRLVEVDYPSNSVTPATSTTKTYDFRNNVINSTDQAGNVTHNTYDPVGRLTSVTRGYGGDNPSTTSYTYYADGRKETDTDPLGHTTTNTYDAAGRLITVTTAAGSTHSVYDDAGNQTSSTDPNGNTTHYEYDARKRLVTTTYPDQTTVTNAYDAAGNIISITDQAGRVVQSNYDAANQLHSVVQVDSPNSSPNNTTTYTYDGAGNQTAMTDENGHTTQNVYDALNRLVSRTLPDGSLTESRQYNAAGNLTSLTHFNGKTTTYTYDTLNRLLTRTPDPSLNEPTVSFAYRLTGKRHTMTDASGTTTYNYDSLDRLTSKATPEGTLSYTYDVAGNVATIVSSNTNGINVSYTYDDLGRLETVVDHRLSGNNTTTYTYDAGSNLATATYPNGVSSTFTFDSLNRLTALSAQASSYTYTLGPTGNRTGATEGTSRTLNWTYDNIYRLTNETITNDPANKNGSVSYTLDPVGNRNSDLSTLPGVTSGSWSYNSDDELTTDNYDANGNTLSTGAKTFTYDSENNLMSMNAGAVTLLYDGDGNRVAKTVNNVTTRYLVDDLNPTGYAQVVDELVNNAVQRRYTYGLERISENQVVDNTWTPSFYGQDGSGSVRQLTDAYRAVIDTYDYDAFGNKLNSTGTTPNNYLYRGEQYDPDLGLYYLRARYYNPATGRFLNVDPMAGQGQRRYQYAAADPVNGADPSGNFVIESYWPLHAPLQIHIPFPSWCAQVEGNSLRRDLPPCVPPCPKCFANLQYRPVPNTGKNHAFWWVEDRHGVDWVTDGGPTGDGHFFKGKSLWGNLTNWVRVGDTGHYQEDNINAPVSPGGEFSGQICDQVDHLLDAAFSWLTTGPGRNGLPYDPVFGPNSNSYARWVGEKGDFHPPGPPNAQAWGAAIP